MAAEKTYVRDFDTEEDELLLLAHMISEPIKQRVMDRPNAFRKFASLNDEPIDRPLEELGDK